MHDKLKKLMDDVHHLVEAIFDSFKFKRLEKLKAEDEPPMPPQEPIAERVKLRKQKTGTEIEMLSPHKLSTRLPVLLAQIKAGNNNI